MTNAPAGAFNGSNMDITGRTRLLGIFGDPVEHTLSPVIQNAAFRAEGLDMVYLPFNVSSRKAGALEEAVGAVRALSIVGINVTVPHKEKIIPFLDELDGHARDLKAVNTVVNDNGRLKGYNTDGPGYLVSLRDELGFTPRGKNILVLGAGGAARAVLNALLGGEPASVMVANRTVKRAEELAGELKKRFKGVDIGVSPLESASLEEYSRAADLVVNTTSAGMNGEGVPDVPVDALPDYSVVSDIVYKPLETPLLIKAEERGLRVHKGLGMLLRQGALAFELWTGHAAPLEAMEEAALKALGLETGVRPVKETRGPAPD